MEQEINWSLIKGKPTFLTTDGGMNAKITRSV